MHTAQLTTLPVTTQSPSQLIQVQVWVRWFDLDTSVPRGFLKRRLHRLKWPDVGDDAVFPDQVLPGVRLIPAFAHGARSKPCAP